MRDSIETMRAGVQLMSKLVVAAADEDEFTTIELIRTAEPDVQHGALIMATKLIAEEIPLLRIARLLGLAETYEEE